MHPLAFHHKRLHLGVTAVGRQMFAHIEEMTPARFDILYLLFRSTPRKWTGAGYLLPQTAITKKLGLTRQTIWKMVNRLVELGLVEKLKGIFSPRRIALRLTDEGLRRIRLAMYAAFSERKPLPKDAPADGDVPRHWRRPELADPVPPDAPPPLRVTAQVAAEYRMRGEPLPRTTLGRDVERTYTGFYWWRIGKRGRTGRRGKKFEHLIRLDERILETKALAEAFGYDVSSIYTMRFTESFDH